MSQSSIKNSLQKYRPALLSLLLLLLISLAAIPTACTTEHSGKIIPAPPSPVRNVTRLGPLSRPQTEVQTMQQTTVQAGIPSSKYSSKSSTAKLVKSAAARTINSRPSQLFPRPQVIAANVRFWENVYGKYSTNERIIHDNAHLNRIYAVATMLEAGLPGAAKINAARERALKQKYRDMLKKLSTTPPTTPEEKRIAALFKGRSRYRDMAIAAENVRSQSGMRERFRAGVIRSGAWLARFRAIFRRYNLPEELAYLPHVESSFYSGARSKVGATGMWQFTKSTGKQYLIINSVVDERLDPITSAEAAAKYFALSYQKVKNWPMTITSYNYGIAGAVRAMEKYRSYPAIFRYHRTAAFQFASRNFYPEFLAACRVAGIVEKGVKMERPRYIVTMQLQGYAALAQLAAYFRVSKEVLMLYNPALKKPALTGSKRIPKGYHLHLPATTEMKQRIAGFPQKLYYSSQIKVQKKRKKKKRSSRKKRKR